MEEDDSWWHVPRRQLSGRYLNGLIVGITGDLRYTIQCSECAEKEAEDMFFASCIADQENRFAGCANCIIEGDGSGCDFYGFGRPVVICLESDCDKTGAGHEHVLRGWLDSRYTNSEDTAVLQLSRCQWTYGIYTSPEFYTDVLGKLRAGEEVSRRVGDALLAASRELRIRGRSPCQVCVTLARNPFTWCTRTPVPSFRGGACPNCILNGHGCYGQDNDENNDEDEDEDDDEEDEEDGEDEREDDERDGEEDGEDDGEVEGEDYYGSWEQDVSEESDLEEWDGH
ncbi:hypothetical protein C8A03DRAFT_39266 [Achaetomium macrosporum]|uniref:Uncharacterized protein n=1 Tax=Achaetomium macrosporum TaxID=79813 RepID=A0AAN7C0M2_9PEZI|nr:hypothetical protein C8A03DRAFT_39266 [Achaetomium macrosporum]